MITRASAKAKGSSFERLIADYLRDEWSKFIDRRVKTGAKDKGDIVNFYLGKAGNGEELVWELKNVREYSLASWVKEAQQEAINAGAIAGVVCVKRPRTTDPAEQYIVTTVGDFLKILRAQGEHHEVAG